MFIDWLINWFMLETASDFSHPPQTFSDSDREPKPQITRSQLARDQIWQDTCPPTEGQWLSPPQEGSRCFPDGSAGKVHACSMDCDPTRLLCLWDFSQARILECVAISFSRGSSWHRDWTHISCTGRQILYHWATREASFWALVSSLIKGEWLFIFR